MYLCSKYICFSASNNSVAGKVMKKKKVFSRKGWRHGDSSNRLSFNASNKVSNSVMFSVWCISYSYFLPDTGQIPNKSENTFTSIVNRPKA